MSESPFDLLIVDGPYTVLRLVDGQFESSKHNGIHEVLRDATYVNVVARRFFEKYPEKRNSVANLNELKVFDEQEKHSIERQD